MIRRHKVDLLCEEMAHILQFDTCLDVTKIIDAIVPCNKINYLINDCESFDLKHLNIGFRQHKTIKNRYLFVAIGKCVIYNIDFIKNSHLRPIWTTAISDFIASFYILTTESEVQLPPTIDKPKLSIFVLSRLYIWKRKQIEKMYTPGHKIVKLLQNDFFKHKNV